MMFFLMLAASVFPGQVNISLAPDQPVPYVYVDDPLIVEFSSQKSVEGAATLEVTPDFGAQPQRVDLGRIKINSQSTFWLPVPELPPLRGRYRVKARFEGPQPVEKDLVFCRIDRPASAPADSELRIKLDDYNVSMGLAVKAAGVKTIALNLSADSPPQIMQALEDGFDVIIAVDVQALGQVERVARDFSGKISGWQFNPGGDAALFASTVKLLRQHGNRAPVSFVLTDPASLEPALAAGYGAMLDAVVLETPWPDTEAIEKLRGIAERAGYEALPIQLSLDNAEDSSDTGAKFAGAAVAVYQDLAALQVGKKITFGESFGPAYSYVSALTQRLSGNSYVGRLALGDNISARVFRRNNGWTLIFWAPAEQELAIPLGAASDVALFDARNNPLELPEIKDGVLTIRAQFEPRYLTGAAGSIIATAAQYEVNRAAETLAASEDNKRHLPEEMSATMKKFQLGESYTRVDFFNLIKLFPSIEDLWHTGNVPRAVAVPALANLERLALPLCILEQERNEPFVEPLQSILANCGQRLSLYLTGSATWDAHERSDWLLSEIDRLMARAEDMANQGRTIEANALANVADWRARALTAAGRAEPLGVPQKEQPPQVAPAPAKEEKKEPAPVEKPKTSKKKSSKSRSRK